MEHKEITGRKIIGIDIGGTKISVVLGTLEGAVLSKLKFPTPEDLNTALDMIFSAVDSILTSASPQAVEAIGISCGGPLDSQRGVILSPPNLPGWDEVHICEMLSGRTAIPCFLENDANACALAEWHWGAGKGCRNLVFLTFGTGLGAGLILDNRLYRGTNGMAGEVGHLRMTADGPEGYGKAGSWEGYCSGGGISRLFRHLGDQDRSAEEICRMAEEGDAAAREVIGKSSHFLGLGISFLIDILNPEVVIVGSIYSRKSSLFNETMSRVIAEEALAVSASVCRVSAAGLGESLGDAAALGVAINGMEVD